MTTTFTYDDRIYSDLHKDAYGFRPGADRCREWASMSPEAKQAEWDSLCATLDRAMTEQAEQEARMVAAFDAAIADLIAVGARDHATAMRWYLDSLELSDTDRLYGGSYICWKVGLPYHMQALFTPYL
jgi:hypothetical protein